MKALLFKSHPAIFPGPATPAQAEAGNYSKRKVAWRGLTISIENEAGTLRHGTNKGTGEKWQQRMAFAYGYANKTLGVDGDHVDVFMGPDLDAPNVYVVHQRRWGNWEAYDEDKCMIGFASEDDAKAAFLASYSDPRFLGPITAMPADEFVEKARATKENPNMIKAVLFFKARVDPYLRAGRVVRGYTAHKPHRVGAHPQLALVFPKPGDVQTVPPPAPPPAPEVKKYYATMIRDPGPRQKVAWLAGPFDTHDEALAILPAAKASAEAVDPRAVFDAFGTTGLTGTKHPPGVLNAHLGIVAKPPAS